MEKKWRQEITMVKISTLLSVSAATYSIALDKSIVETNFIILGISLVCASIIIQKQANFQSIDSAITLWCSGIIGLLIGAEFFLLAYGSTLAIMGAKLVFSTEYFRDSSSNFIPEESIDSPELEELEPIIDEPSNTLAVVQKYYHCQIMCDFQSEANVLASMVQSVQEQNIILTGLQSSNESSNQVKINAKFLTNNHECQIELQKVFQSIKSQGGVNSVSWHQVINK